MCFVRNFGFGIANSPKLQCLLVIVFGFGWRCWERFHRVLEWSEGSSLSHHARLSHRHICWSCRKVSWAWATAHAAYPWEEARWRMPVTDFKLTDRLQQRHRRMRTRAVRRPPRQAPSTTIEMKYFSSLSQLVVGVVSGAPVLVGGTPDTVTIKGMVVIRASGLCSVAWKWGKFGSWGDFTEVLLICNFHKIPALNKYLEFHFNPPTWSIRTTWVSSEEKLLGVPT